MDSDMVGPAAAGGLAPEAVGGERGKLRGLLLDYGDRWEIEQGAAWVACTRDGSFTHVIAAHSLDDLRTKIAAAEQPGAAGADPGERP
jgi:hypothetical protein